MYVTLLKEPSIVRYCAAIWSDEHIYVGTP